MKDSELLSLISRGNKNAFDELFLLYYKELCRFAVVFLHDQDESEEAVQIMFVRLWENRRKLTFPENIRSYLFKSVYNECLKTIRSQTNRQKYHGNYYSYLMEETSDEDRPALEQIMPYLNKAIENLPERCRQIFILNKLEGMRQKEIAELLQISVKTVENQVAISITKLRAELKPVIHLLPAGLLLLDYLLPK